MKTITVLTQIVLTMTGFQLILLASVLLHQETRNRLSRNLLVAFLAVKALLIIRWLLFGWDILPAEQLMYPYHISKSLFFLLAPLVFFYFRTFCFKDFAFRPRHLSHGVLFLLFTVYSSISVHILKSQSVPETSVIHQIFIAQHNRIFWTTNFIQILLYIISLLHIVLRYRHRLRSSQSSLDRYHLNWLYGLVALISLHWLFVVYRALVGLFLPDATRLTALVDLYSISIFLAFTTALILHGLSQLKIIAGVDSGEKYLNSHLPLSDIQTYTAQLVAYMDSQKPYLEPGLTIDDLSEQLAIPVWKLSQVINYSFQQNFFNFINSYRIQEVKQKLIDPQNNRKTILEILYETGFNSKSTFNDVFKKTTGKTPKEFRRAIHPQSMN
ncbi:MAG: helix-turn-helix domain-containing protein [Candidatus Zhuqueibacterota bacterium]